MSGQPHWGNPFGVFKELPRERGGGDGNRWLGERQGAEGTEGGLGREGWRREEEEEGGEGMEGLAGHGRTLDFVLEGKNGR